MWQFLAGVVCVLAAILQLAVYRSPDVYDTLTRATARRITIAALAMAGMYLLYLLSEPMEHTVSPVLVLGLGLLGFGQILFACNNLFDNLEKGHPKWRSHLHSSD